MGLHETLTTEDGIFVVRVPGGWVYTLFGAEEYQLSSVFVPYNDEFDSYALTMKFE